MKSLFSFAFFIGSARPPEMIQSSPVGPCASTNLNPITFVVFESPKQYKHFSITNAHAEMEVHAIEQRC